MNVSRPQWTVSRAQLRGEVAGRSRPAPGSPFPVVEEGALAPVSKTPGSWGGFKAQLRGEVRRRLRPAPGFRFAPFRWLRRAPWRPSRNLRVVGRVQSAATGRGTAGAWVRSRLSLRAFRWLRRAPWRPSRNLRVVGGSKAQLRGEVRRRLRPAPGFRFAPFRWLRRALRRPSRNLRVVGGSKAQLRSEVGGCLRSAPGFRSAPFRWLRRAPRRPSRNLRKLLGNSSDQRLDSNTCSSRMEPWTRAPLSPSQQRCWTVPGTADGLLMPPRSSSCRRPWSGLTCIPLSRSTTPHSCLRSVTSRSRSPEPVHRWCRSSASPSSRSRSGSRPRPARSTSVRPSSCATGSPRPGGG